MVRYALAAALTLLLVSCSEGPVESASLADPGRSVTPQGSDEIILAVEASTVQSANGATLGMELKVRLPDEYIPSQAIMANLDFDDTEEQIIVFKRRDDPDDRIRLLVVSYDPVRNSWIRSWEGATGATSTRSFTVYADDLVGDHDQEVVAFGINSDGEQTLDVFRRTSDALGFGLAYTRILSVEADITIRIEAVPRSEAYEDMATVAAPSYPVIVERRDTESANEFDTIQTTYFWDYPSRRYIVGRVDAMSGEVVQDDRLRTLFAGSERDFERFLHGPWFRSSGAEDLQIAFFGSRDRSVSFSSGDLQQAFIWDDSTKTLYGRGIQLFVINENLRTVKRLISVSAQSLNQITIAVQGSDDLGGVYDRLSGALQSVLLPRSSRARISDVSLSGLFRGDLGQEVVFSGSAYTFRQGDLVHTGGFVMFELGDEMILSMKSIDENRLPVRDMTYRVVYEEAREEDRVARTMTLEPGELGISGFFESGGEQFTLEQVELLESSGSSSQSAQ